MEFQECDFALLEHLGDLLALELSLSEFQILYDLHHYLHCCWCFIGKRPKKGMATAKQRLGKILKLNRNGHARFFV